jgi:hypothetical protein
MYVNDTLLAVYQWGGVVFGVMGFVLAVVGLVVRGDIPLIGHRTWSDSAVGHVCIGVGIATIWPLVLAIVVIAALQSRLSKGREPR